MSPLFFLFGLLVGSFANVIVLRLHSGKKGIFTGRSECPKCHHALGFFDLFPVLSYIFLRGKCRYCRKKISVQYPIVEIIMGILWGFVAYMIPLEMWGQLIFSLIIITSLFIITVYDLKYMEIPDEVSLPTIIFLLFTLPFSWTISWDNALIGAVIPLGFFGFQILISRGKWMGMGDLRLGAIMGLTLGWEKTIFALFIAYFLGALTGIFLIIIREKRLSSHIPFGPFLAIGMVVGMFAGDEMILFWKEVMAI